MGTSAFRGNYTVIHPTVNGYCACENWKKMACEDCSAKFTVIKRKKNCCDCKNDFCSSCVVRVKGMEKKHRCRRCRIFSTVPLDRSAIMNLRVRDLRWYLDSKSISIQGCKEKSDLVELIMHHAGGLNSGRYGQADYLRHHTYFPSSYEDNGHCSDSRCGSSPSSPIRTHESSSNNYAGPSCESDLHEDAQQGTYRSPDTGSLTAGFYASVHTPSEFARDTLLSEMAADMNAEPVQQEADKDHEQDSFRPMTVEDVKDPNQIAQLSVRQMKLILTRNFVDYKGCCEKQDLQEKVHRLWVQKCEGKDIDALPDENLCKICMEAAIDSVLLECGHMATCTECGKRLHECPICRQYVVRVVHTFKA